MTTLAELLQCTRADLLDRAGSRSIAIAPHLEHDELARRIAEDLLANDEEVHADGILAVLPDGFGFVRLLASDFAATAIDAYVSQGQIKSLNLRTGHRIRGRVRAPRGGENFFALVHVDEVHGVATDRLHDVTVFEARTPITANRAANWCAADDNDATLQALQHLAPIQHGHRVLVHAPADYPRAQLLARIAAAQKQQHDDIDVSMCLLDQRPEDLATLRHHLRSFDCHVVGTAFADAPDRHVAVADMALKRAMRHVEQGRDAWLLVDSLTALTRASSRAQAPSGAWIQPGLDARAVHAAKQLFASARQCAEGGSLTIIATVTTGEEGTIDEAIEREFRTFTNSDIRLVDTRDLGEDVLPFCPTGTRTRPEDDPTSPADRRRRNGRRDELAALPLENRTFARLGG